MAKFDAVIFDFDGTIADTGRGIFASVQAALQEIGRPQLSEEVVRTFIGPPIQESFSVHCGLAGDELEAVVAAYRRIYSATGIHELDVYAGVLDLLQTLHANGILLAVGSSKPQPFIEHLVEHLGLSACITAPCGASLHEFHADKTGILLRAMAQMEVTDPARVLMVGDRKYDIEGAKGAGLQSVGILWGYGTREELTAAGADFLIEAPAELLALVI